MLGNNTEMQAGGFISQLDISVWSSKQQMSSIVLQVYEALIDAPDANVMTSIQDQ